MGLFTALSWAAALAAPPSPEGVWRTPTHHAIIAIVRCGGALCGRLVTSDEIVRDPGRKDFHNADPALRDRSLKGLVILTGFTGGPVAWGNGRAYNPEDGRTYRASFRVIDGRTLRLSGCIIFPLCLAQTWTRAE